jgi:hypothetical protein
MPLILGALSLLLLLAGAGPLPQQGPKDTKNTKDTKQTKDTK